MRILLLEPWMGGSHARFVKTLTENIDAEWSVRSLPARHWKWRMRGAALRFALESEPLGSFDLVLATSYTNLADLVALSPELRDTPILFYFHENQLAYPTRSGSAAERDNHFGFSQLVSCLVATRCLFNSAYNLQSFLEEGRRLLQRLPDKKPPGLMERVEARCEVMPLPLDLDPDPPLVGRAPEPELGPTILWNHRWEFDKGPDIFFGALFALADAGLPFRLRVLGQRFGRAPAVFEEAKVRLHDRIDAWGFAESAHDYRAHLEASHIVASTAHHEFFGVSVMEAVHYGARPLVPDRLSYPELFGPEFRYADDESFCAALRSVIERGVAGEIELRGDRRNLTRRFGQPLLERYRGLFESVADL